MPEPTPPARPPARLEARGLRRTFGEVEALAGLDLELEPGTFTALLGPSGCGKSTALAVVAGLERPDAGDVRIDGASVLTTPPERRPVSLVLQKPLLFPHLSVGQNVDFGLRAGRVPRAERGRRVAEGLDRVHLGGFEDRRPHELSGGQEQRVALARALVRRPRLLLLDEPFSQLDPDLRARMRELVRELHNEQGVTTLFVTHDREEAIGVADRIVLMLDGAVSGSGTPQEVYTRPPTLAMSDFFGFTGRIPGRVGDGRFVSDDGLLVRLTTVRDGGAVLVIRPESVVLGRGELEALVVGTRFAGTHVEVTVALDDGVALTAHVEVGAAPATGCRVRVTLPQDRTTVLVAP